MTNPMLNKLGYADTDRLVIIHTDDIGMCQASVQAYQDLWDFGTISSGAVMVPCPWFPFAAKMCRDHPQMDMGVHATLNAEWDLYRWGAVSTSDPSSGLIDGEGFLWRSSVETQESADADAVTVELQAQVRKAQRFGIDITHVDTHMGTVANAKFIPAYLQAAAQIRVPAMLPRMDAVGMAMMGFDDTTRDAMIGFLGMLEEQGVPLLDGLISMPLDHPDDQVGIAKEKLLQCPRGGITHFIFHPSVDTPELRSICDDWQSRVANYNAFMSKEIKDFIRNEGIQLIGYRAIRDAMRQT